MPLLLALTQQAQFIDFQYVKIQRGKQKVFQNTNNGAGIHSKPTTHRNNKIENLSQGYNLPLN